MKVRFLMLAGALAVTFCSCKKDDQNSNVISQRYIHKYGYAVSKEEWDVKNYPGQAVTHMRNGVTLTATYENGTLHGPTTHTFPNSQTVQYYYLYNQGSKVKEIVYDPSGMPFQEKIQLSPTRYTMTMWYADGTPMLVEDCVGEELLEGQYFTVNNEIEARIEKGNGKKVIRDQKGTLSSKEDVQGGYTIRKETFHSNGAPESVCSLYRGKLNGELKTFSITGEPMAIEEWVNGKLRGKSTYFRNGTKYLEVSYLNGEKNGLEIQFVDGSQVSQEVVWENNKMHGPAKFYLDGSETTSWYYDGKQVSRHRFDELNRLDQMIGNISSDFSADTVNK